MRASPALVVGLIAGGALGFLLRGLFVEEGARGEASGEQRTTVTGTAAVSLPAVTPAPAESLAPSALATDPHAAGATGESSGGAPDALVGIVVYGAVLEPGGKPARIGDRRWMYFEGAPGRRTVQVSDESLYSLAGLQPGTWKLRTDFDGYRPERLEVELDGSQPTVRLDIVVKPAVSLLIKGFTPSGERLADALGSVMGPDTFSVPLGAIATREPPPTALPEISVRLYDRWGIGSFRPSFEMLFGDEALPEDVLGRLELDESLPAHVSLVFRHLVVQTQLVEPGAQEVVFVVPLEALTALLGGLRVEVIDSETRQPLADARAELSDSQSGGMGQPSTTPGLFIWEKQRPGLLELQITAPGHEQWDGEVSIAPGAVTDLGTLELTPATSVKGVVLDAAGAPVSVGLRALADEGRGLGMGARRYQKSGTDGRFTCDGLGRRRYLLMVSNEDWAGLPVPVDLRHGDVEGVVVNVEPGVAVQLRSTWPEDQTYDVRLVTGDGLLLSEAEWRGDWIRTRRLPVGEFVAVISRDGRELNRVSFRVGQEPLTVELAP